MNMAVVLVWVVCAYIAWLNVIGDLVCSRRDGLMLQPAVEWVSASVVWRCVGFAHGLGLRCQGVLVVELWASWGVRNRVVRTEPSTWKTPQLDGGRVFAGHGVVARQGRESVPDEQLGSGPATRFRTLAGGEVGTHRLITTEPRRNPRRDHTNTKGAGSRNRLDHARHPRSRRFTLGSGHCRSVSPMAHRSSPYTEHPAARTASGRAGSMCPANRSPVIGLPSSRCRT